MHDEIRPTTQWRTARAEEAADVAAGAMSPDDAYLGDLFPDRFLDGAERALTAYEVEVEALATDPSGFTGAMEAVKNVVLALNTLNEEGDGAWIETDERERLCEFIDEVLRRHGIDTEVLAASQKIDRWELTDAWRDW